MRHFFIAGAIVAGCIVGVARARTVEGADSAVRAVKEADEFPHEADTPFPELNDARPRKLPRAKETPAPQTDEGE
jgi:hypothetical protein